MAMVRGFRLVEEQRKIVERAFSDLPPLLQDDRELALLEAVNDARGHDLFLDVAVANRLRAGGFINIVTSLTAKGIERLRSSTDL